jgi:hypothetical protein
MENLLDSWVVLDMGFAIKGPEEEKHGLLVVY